MATTLQSNKLDTGSPIDQNIAPALTGNVSGATTSVQGVAGTKPNALQPVNEPTPIDFLKEAKQLGTELFESQAEQLRGETKGQASDLARQLFGQNVGGTSGIGQDIVQRTLAEQQGRLEPVAKEIATRTAQEALGQRFQSEEALKGREFSAGQAQLGRDFSSEEADLSREFSSREAALGRSFSSEEAATVRREIRQNALFDQVLQGNLTGEGATAILDDFGLNIEDLKIPDRRESTIDNFIQAAIANGESPDVNLLNQFLSFGGQDPLSGEEFIRAGGGIGVKFNNSQLQSKLLGLGLTPDREGGIEDTTANRNKLRNLYQDNEDIRSLLDEEFGL